MDAKLLTFIDLGQNIVALAERSYFNRDKTPLYLEYLIEAKFKPKSSSQKLFLMSNLETILTGGS